MHRTLEGLPCSGPWFAYDPGSLLQILVGELLLLGERMPGRTEDHEFILTPGCRLNFWIDQLALDESDIQFEVLHLASNLFSVGHMQSRARPCPLPHEARHEWHDHVVANREGRADAEESGSTSLRQQGLEFVSLFLESLALSPDGAPEFTQFKSLTDSFEKPHIKLLLEITQCAAHRGLGHVQMHRSAAHAFEPGHVQENFQLSQGKSHIAIPDNTIRNIPFYRSKFAK